MCEELLINMDYRVGIVLLILRIRYYFFLRKFGYFLDMSLEKDKIWN